jgi:MFS superfamily sulfate permease-like transporter
MTGAAGNTAVIEGDFACAAVVSFVSFVSFVAFVSFVLAVVFGDVVSVVTVLLSSAKAAGATKKMLANVSQNTLVFQWKVGPIVVQDRL